MKAGIGILVAGVIATSMATVFFLDEGQKRLDTLMNDFESFIGSANDVVGDKENRENFERILANLADVSEQARQAMQEFRELATTATRTLKNADARVENISTAVINTSEEICEFTAAGTSTLASVDAEAENLRTVVAGTSRQFGDALELLKSILDKVNNGQGTAAKVVNDADFCEALLKNAEQMRILLEQMQSAIAKWGDKKVQVKLF